MNADDNDPLHAAINAGLAKALSSLSTTPSWYGAWIQLDPRSTETDRLAVYQAVRDSGCLPKEAGFFLVMWQIDAMSSMEAETGLRNLDDRLQAIEDAYELEHEEPWSSDEVPREYVDLLEQHHAAWDQIFLAKLEESGKQETDPLRVDTTTGWTEGMAGDDGTEVMRNQIRRPQRTGSSRTQAAFRFTRFP